MQNSLNLNTIIYSMYSIQVKNFTCMYYSQLNIFFSLHFGGAQRKLTQPEFI